MQRETRQRKLVSEILMESMIIQMLLLFLEEQRKKVQK